jgi:hypothetical protein
MKFTTDSDSLAYIGTGMVADKNGLEGAYKNL